MSVATNLERPCTISESIMQSCKEVKNMREGRMPKRFLNDLFTNIEKWSKEEEKNIYGYTYWTVWKRCKVLYQEKGVHPYRYGY